MRTCKTLSEKTNAVSYVLVTVEISCVFVVSDRFIGI